MQRAGHSTQRALFVGIVAACALAAWTKFSWAANPVYPLKVRANGRYLVDQNNAPFESRPWYNTAIAASPLVNAGLHTFTPPGNNHDGDGDWVLALETTGGTASNPSKPITVPLRALAMNSNYFTDGSGKAVYLTGSHTWNNVQDWGTNGSIQTLDFAAYVKMLVAHHHNFTLLWATELPTFRGLPTTAKSPPDFSVTPHPWQRTGPGNASDGKLKFDLTKFNQAYFDRLRDRVQQLHAAGIYAGVYLFSGEWLLRFRFSGDGYPLTGSNNVNGIDDGGRTGVRDHDRAECDHGGSGRLREKGDRHPQRPAECALDRLPGSTRETRSGGTTT